MLVGCQRLRANIRLHLTAIDECIFAVALQLSAPAFIHCATAFIHCAPASLRSREAAREGGHIEPFTFTFHLVCGTAKAVVFRSVAYAFPICTGHSQSDVRLGAQFTYLAWNKLGNGRFQWPLRHQHAQRQSDAHEHVNIFFLIMSY